MSTTAMIAGTIHEGRSNGPRLAGLRATVGLRAGDGAIVESEAVEVAAPAAEPSVFSGSQTPLVIAVHVGFGASAGAGVAAGGFGATGLAAGGSYRGVGTGGSYRGPGAGGSYRGVGGGGS